MIKFNRGFTFIEMLLAIAIFAVVGLSSTSILNSIQTTNEVSITHGDRIQALQLTMLTIERDLRQASKRKVRVEGEAPTDNFIAHGNQILDSQSQVLALRKVGWINPMNLLPRSEVQSFAYRVVDDTLERIHYDFADPAIGAEFKVRPLLTGVKNIQFEFHDGKAEGFSESWSSKGLPAAIAVTLELEDMGEIRRILLLPEGV